MPVIIGGSGVGLSTAPIEVTLAGAQSMIVPSGQYIADVGRYTVVQWLDPNTGIWRNRYPSHGARAPLVSDGTNMRLTNYTGCPAGAILTAKGTGYTNGVGTVAVTVSSGNSVWQAIVGGAFSSAVTVTTAGAYSYPPTIVFPAPPTGGLRATATAAIASSVISSITMVNRGAGWTGTVPTSIALNNTSTTPASAFFNPQSQQIQIVQDPRDTLAGGGVITLSSALADSGAITGLVMTDPGTAALTSLPTLSFASGVASAIVIMNWTVTGFTIGNAGAGYGNAQPIQITGTGLTNTSTAYTGDLNPAHNIGILTPRNFLISGVSTSAGAVSSATPVIEDAGWGIQRVPDAVVVQGAGSASAIPSVNAILTMTVGATSDTSWLEPAKL